MRWDKGLPLPPSTKPNPSEIPPEISSRRTRLRARWSPRPAGGTLFGQMGLLPPSLRMEPFVEYMGEGGRRTFPSLIN